MTTAGEGMASLGNTLGAQRHEWGKAVLWRLAKFCRKRSEGKIIPGFSNPFQDVSKVGSFNDFLICPAGLARLA